MATVMNQAETNLLSGDQTMATVAITPTSLGAEAPMEAVPFPEASRQHR